MDEEPRENRSVPVLLVEDNAFLRRTLQELLETAGHPVTTAADGAEALARIAERHYPIVLTDWLMPVMDGRELCRAIRRRPDTPYTYIILLTSLQSREDRIAGLEAGADEYLVKPVDEAELRARLRIARRILDLESTLKKSLEELRTLAVRDPLTGFFNRRFLVDRLPAELKRASRYERPFSVILFDLDHFKEVNDRFGHSAGDRVLQACARALESSLREDLDWVVRYGGEEFLVVLPETDLEGAKVVAERVRTAIAATTTEVEKRMVRVTASLGVASLPPLPRRERLAMEVLLEGADRCLYQAKHAGRNQIRGITL